MLKRAKDKQRAVEEEKRIWDLHMQQKEQEKQRQKEKDWDAVEERSLEKLAKLVRLTEPTTINLIEHVVDTIASMPNLSTLRAAVDFYVVLSSPHSPKVLPLLDNLCDRIIVRIREANFDVKTLEDHSKKIVITPPPHLLEESLM